MVISTPPNRQTIAGPVGRIELLVDAPKDAARGLAMVAHPHPSQGGGPEHKVPAYLAKTLREGGWVTVRPSFRGVGETEGSHDEGNGESDDLVAVAKWARSTHPGLPLALVGFSFGAFVQAQVARKLAEAGEGPVALALAGLATGDVPGHRHYEAGTVPWDALVIHGERDDRVPLQSVLRWAEPQNLLVTVVAGTDHFFARKLPVLARAVANHLERSLWAGR